MRLIMFLQKSAFHNKMTVIKYYFGWVLYLLNKPLYNNFPWAKKECQN